MKTILWLTLAGAASQSPTRIDQPKLAHLFGFRPHHEVQLRDESRSLPLSWRLLGTLRSGDGTSLAAIDCAGRTLTVAIGDVVEGTEVVDIEKLALMVRRNGNIERLTYAPTTQPTLPVPRSLSRHTVEQALANPQGLLREVMMMPAMVTGRMVGFKATWVKEGSLIDRIGLKKGDVITRVNGVPLDGPEKVVALLSTFATTRRFEVELERDGQRLVESLDLTL